MEVRPEHAMFTRRFGNVPVGVRFGTRGRRIRDDPTNLCEISKKLHVYREMDCYLRE